MFKLWNQASRADLLDRRELLRVGGLSVLVPHTARWMHKIGLVRTMNHTHNDHGRGSYWMFTGYQYPGSVPDVNSMSRADMPHMGSIVAKLAPGQGPMFPFALVPHRMDVSGGR